MLTPDQQQWLDKHKCKRLTFGLGVPIEQELFQTRRGALTIPRIMELEEAEAEYSRRSSERLSLLTIPASCAIISCSLELENRNERHIQTHGFSMF